MEDKKNILTYEGLKAYEEELENLKVPLLDAAGRA